MAPYCVELQIQCVVVSGCILVFGKDNKTSIFCRTNSSHDGLIRIQDRRFLGLQDASVGVVELKVFLSSGVLEGEWGFCGQFCRTKRGM